MITDTKEIAERLRTEADYRRDYNEDDTIFNMSNYHVTESVLITFDKLADIIDPQSS